MREVDFSQGIKYNENQAKMELSAGGANMGARVISELASQYFTGRSEVLAAYLYGSQAEGRASALSDIDIGVLIRGGLAEERLWRLEDALAADLRRILRTDKVDLIVLNLTPLRIRYEVIIRGKVLYSADDGARADFESYSLRRYWDFEKYLEEYDRCFLTRIKEAMDETQRRQYQDTSAKVRAVHRRVKEAADSHFRAV
jgi:predicted nucleotidyltransferase